MHGPLLPSSLDSDVSGCALCWSNSSFLSTFLVVFSAALNLICSKLFLLPSHPSHVISNGFLSIAFAAVFSVSGSDGCSMNMDGMKRATRGKFARYHCGWADEMSFRKSTDAISPGMQGAKGYRCPSGTLFLFCALYRCLTNLTFEGVVSCVSVSHRLVFLFWGPLQQGLEGKCFQFCSLLTHNTEVHSFCS